MSERGERLEESPGFMRGLLVLSVILFVIVECEAAFLVVHQNGFHFDALSVWSLPLILSVPFVAGIRYYSSTRKLVASTGVSPILTRRIQYYLVTLIALAYVALGAVFTAFDMAKR